jgi:transposase
VRHGQTGFEALLTGLSVKRPHKGRLKSKAAILIADRGYAGAPMRNELRRRGTRAAIPTRSTAEDQLATDRAAYAQRDPAKRLINRLKQYRRIAARYGKRSDISAAFLTLVAIRCWLR